MIEILVLFYAVAFIIGIIISLIFYVIFYTVFLQPTFTILEKIKSKYKSFKAYIGSSKDFVNL